MISHGIVSSFFIYSLGGQTEMPACPWIRYSPVFEVKEQELNSHTSTGAASSLRVQLEVVIS